MKQETINFFIGFILGFFVCLILVCAIKVHLINPKEQEIMKAYRQKKEYYEEIFKSDKYVKYFVEGPLMMYMINPKHKWDPNQLEVK